MAGGAALELGTTIGDLSAGGLAIADRMLFPGRLSRRESLARCADEVTPIAIGAMLMFFVAALIEGGLRQVVQETGLRLGIGLGIGALWAAYFFRPPREGGR